MHRTLFSNHLQVSPSLEKAWETLGTRFLPVGLSNEGVIVGRRMKDDCMSRSLRETSPRAAADSSRLHSHLPLIPQKEESSTRPTRPTRQTQPETQKLSRARARSTERDDSLFHSSLGDVMRKRESKNQVRDQKPSRVATFDFPSARKGF